MNDKAPGWKEIPIGGVIVHAGNSFEYETGDWRSERPVVDKEKCIDCLQCWIFCPDGTVLVEDEKMAGFDLKHCKGCEICAYVCPVKAIEMFSEDDLDAIPADEWGIRNIPAESKD
jgi:pyruvate ferredoxin oxidoreductase delta subunit